jgi:predicted porin
MKKTAIALAVAAIAAAPLAAQADAGAYASVRVAISNTDAGDGADAQWNVDNEASRFGFQGSEDLGNGLKVVGRYEFGVDASAGSLQVGNNTRLSYAGIEGDFGGVYLGSQWTPFYLMVGGAVDRLNGASVPLFGYSTVRSGDALAYVGNFGGATVAVAGIMDTKDYTAAYGNDDDMFQRIQAAAKIPAGPVTIGVAVDSVAEVNGVAGSDGMRTGASIEWKSGAVTVAGNFIVGSDSLSKAGSADDQTNFGLYAGFDLGGGNLIHGSFEQEDTGGNSNPTGLALGYQKSLSKTSRLWAEFAQKDIDDGSDADTELNFGIRKDW